MPVELALPLPEELLPEVMPASVSDIELDERHLSYAQQRWPDKTPSMQAYNVRRSIWGKMRTRVRHPDDPNRNLFGGPQPRSGPKPTKAIGQALVEAAEARSKEVLDAAFAPLSPNSGATPMERHKAAMGIAEHARREAREKRDADAFARLTDEEVRMSVAEEILKMVVDGKVNLDDIQSFAPGAAVVDAEVVDSKTLPPA